MSKLYLNKEQKKSARNRLLYLLNKYPFPLWENTPDVKAEIIQLRILLGLSTMDKSKPLKKNSLVNLDFDTYQILLEQGYSKTHIQQATSLTKTEFTKFVNFHKKKK